MRSATGGGDRGSLVRRHPRCRPNSGTRDERLQWMLFAALDNGNGRLTEPVAAFAGVVAGALIDTGVRADQSVGRATRAGAAGFSAT